MQERELTVDVSGSGVQDSMEGWILSASDTSIRVGHTGTIEARLSAVPATGLAGFDVTIGLAGDDEVATIEDGSYPSDFGLQQEPDISDEGTTINLKAADVDEEITGGKTDIELATIEVRGETPGTTAVTIRLNELSDDNGDFIEASITQGAVRVEGDGDEETTTQPATTTTDAETSTTPEPSTKGASNQRLRRASQVGSIRIENEQFYVFRNIPNEPDARYAFTDANKNLVEPDRAVDIAVSHTFRNDYIFRSQDRLEYTLNQHREAEGIEDMASLANVLSELSGAIAMAKLDPVASVQHAADAVQAGLTWEDYELNDPYRDQFAKMATTCNTVYWADNHVPDPSGSFLNTSNEALEIGQVMLDASTLVDAGQKLSASAKTVQSVLKQSDSIFTDVSADQVNGVSDLKTAGFTAIVSLTTDAVVGAVSAIAETQAKCGALLAGNAGARGPLIQEMITLENRLREGRLGPSGILRLQSLRQTDYQMEAAALDAVAVLQGDLSNGNFGPGYDALFNVDDIANRYNAGSQAWADLSHFTMAATGKEFERALQRYHESLNAKEFGDQQVFEYQ